MNTEYRKVATAPQPHLPPELNIVIPTFNESIRLPKTLWTLTQFLKNNHIPAQVTICDDGSTDYTPRTITQEISLYPSVDISFLPSSINKGKGDAVRRGLAQNKTPFSIFMDADLSTPPSEIPHILAALKQAPKDNPLVVIASRAHPNTTVTEQQPPSRKRMEEALNKLSKFLIPNTCQPLPPDTQCGFKGFNQTALDILLPKLKTNGFTFDIEILSLANLSQIKTQVIPTTWCHKETSRVRPIYHLISAFFELLTIRKNLIHHGA